MPNLKIPPPKPSMKFTDQAGALSKDAYEFLFGLFQRVGGSLSSLNAVTLEDGTWDSPNPIGVVTPTTGKFTTLETSSDAVIGGYLNVMNEIHASKGLRIKSGANTKMGTATLVAGTVTVANTSVTSTSVIFLTSQVDGGTVGFLRVSAKTNGTSFVITSSSPTDTSTVGWLIIEKG